MTYHAMNAYYTFRPHEMMSGMGNYRQHDGAGSYYTFRPHEIMSGFGAVKDTFNPDQILGDIATSNVCYGGTNKPSAACNAASQRANKEISAALNALGYGPLAVDGRVNWESAYGQFLADHGLSKGPGFGITRQALLLMKQLLQEGKTPGPGEVTEYEKVGGEYIPADRGIGRAGIALGILAVAGVAAVGIVAMRKRKKRKGK